MEENRMKKKMLAGLISVTMAAAMLAGCGGSSAPADKTPETKAAETEAAETEAASETAAETEAEAGAQDAFAKEVATFMADHGRPVGDLIVDLETPTPEELTEEEGAEMDRAMRAYTPSVDSLLVNNAKSFYFYEQLDDDQKEIYDSLLMVAEDPTDLNNIAAIQLSAPPDDVFYSDVLSPAYFALLYDHPELFWLYGNTDNYLGFGSSYQNGQNILYIGYTEPYTTYEQDMKTFNQAAEDFLKDIDLNGSESQIADAIHDKLIDMVVYDHEVAENHISNDLAHTAYGALVANSRGDKNTCVCDGYSLAYVYLCQQAGLEATFLCGMAGTDEASAGGHAWSIVKVDGKWNEVDACWDDFDDLFDDLLEAYGSGDDESSRKIRQALSDEAFRSALMHYLDCVTTPYITSFNDIDPFIYDFGDGTALVLISESVHIRMDDAMDGGPDAYLMALAPIAE